MLALRRPSPPPPPSSPPPQCVKSCRKTGYCRRGHHAPSPPISARAHQTAHKTSPLALLHTDAGGPALGRGGRGALVPRCPCLRRGLCHAPGPKEGTRSNACRPFPSEVNGAPLKGGVGLRLNGARDSEIRRQRPQGNGFGSKMVHSSLIESQTSPPPPVACAELPGILPAVVLVKGAPCAGGLAVGGWRLVAVGGGWRLVTVGGW